MACLLCTVDDVPYYLRLARRGKFEWSLKILIYSILIDTFCLFSIINNQCGHAFLLSQGPLYLFLSLSVSKTNSIDGLYFFVHLRLCHFLPFFSEKSVSFLFI